MDFSKWISGKYQLWLPRSTIESWQHGGPSGFLFDPASERRGLRSAGWMLWVNNWFQADVDNRDLIFMTIQPSLRIEYCQEKRQDPPDKLAEKHFCQ